jgi:hypothetical protein
LEWWKTARGQLGLVSLLIEAAVLLLTSRVIYQGTLLAEGSFPSIFGPPPEYYFVKYYQNGYGWVFTAVFATIGIIAQISITRRLLRHLDARDKPYQHRLLLKVYGVCLIGIIVLAYLGATGIAHLFMLMVSLFAPGLWPTFLTLKHHEKNHQVNLIISRLAFQVDSRALKTPKAQ